MDVMISDSAELCFTIENASQQFVGKSFKESSEQLVFSAFFCHAKCVSKESGSRTTRRTWLHWNHRYLSVQNDDCRKSMTVVKHLAMQQICDELRSK
ncbi:hypothetical protein AB6A40_006716 [Gnathostoma spinigerum]|uniref:Uncharacterized protein n=1 Tax=Gnathostoma spinigerum TaxID=75299 RepID=A0ABD6ELC8_9BILA